MRKGQLEVGKEYALWMGRGSFAVPREGWRAERAVDYTHRVRLLDNDKPAEETDEWLIPPKANGIVVVFLDRDTGEEIRVAKDGESKLKTKWFSTARDIPMLWSEFDSIVTPIMERIAEREAHEKELLGLGDSLKAETARSAGLSEDAINVDLYEWRDRTSGEIKSETARIEIKFETIADARRWLGNRT